MVALISDKGSPASPDSTLKTGKRQSRRREAILDAFRSFNSHAMNGDEQLDDEDLIARHNASVQAGIIKSQQPPPPPPQSAQRHHGRSKSFFLGSSKKTSGEGEAPGAENERARPEPQSTRTLEQVSDLVCLAAEKGAAAADEQWRSRQSERVEQADEPEYDYTALYSQVLLPSNVSSQRNRPRLFHGVSSESLCHTQSPRSASGPVSPLPPKRFNQRRRVQSVAAMRCERVVAVTPETHYSIEELAYHQDCAQPGSFGIVSESSHSFQSLSALRPRRCGPEPIQRRKASVSSSGHGSSCGSPKGSPDSFVSANSQWATRSRSSSIASSATSHCLTLTDKAADRELLHPLPPIPARFLSKNVEDEAVSEGKTGHSDVLKTPTFGQVASAACSAPPQSHSPSMQSAVSNTTSVFEAFPTAKPTRNVTHCMYDDAPLLPSMQISAPAPSGLGLSHVKLALAKNIRPLRRDSALAS